MASCGLMINMRGEIGMNSSIKDAWQTVAFYCESRKNDYGSWNEYGHT